jgi:hypothetical protein
MSGATKTASQTPQPREPLIDNQGNITRTWWRYLNSIGAAAGTAGPTGAPGAVGATGTAGAAGPTGAAGPAGSSDALALVLAVASWAP